MVRDQTTENLGSGEPRQPEYSFVEIRDLLFETAQKVEEMYKWFQEKKRQQLTEPIDSATKKIIKRASQ